MTKQILELRLVLCLTAFAAALAGCAFSQPKGPAFSPETPISGQALIYFYRLPGERMGYNRTYSVLFNGQRLKDLEHGGYYPYETSPAHVKLTSKGTMANAGAPVNVLAQAIETSSVPPAQMEFDAEAGHVYYVKLHIQTHFTYFEPTLSLVSENDGEKEIAQCRLVVP